MRMHEAGTMWIPLKSKRSKAGNLPPTRMIVSGVDGIAGINESVNDADDANRDDLDGEDDEDSEFVVAEMQPYHDYSLQTAASVETSEEDQLPLEIAQDLRRQSVRTSAARGKKTLQSWAIAESCID